MERAKGVHLQIGFTEGQLVREVVRAQKDQEDYVRKVGKTGAGEESTFLCVDLCVVCVLLR